MKYEFKEISLDEYELHYTDKNGNEVVKPFKRTVELATKLQSGDVDARMEFYSNMTKAGKTKDDYIIKREVDGKIIYDETNYRELESDFITKRSFEIAMEIYRTLFGMDFMELLLDMGLSEETADDFKDNMDKFSLELREILIHGKKKTPSTNKKEQDK